MIKEVTMYTVICDNCGADANDGQDYAGWSDRGYTEDSALDSDWIKEGDKHYCDRCFSYGDEDEIVIDTSRTKSFTQQPAMDI